MQVLFTVFNRKPIFFGILIMAKIIDVMRVNVAAISIILLELHSKSKDFWRMGSVCSAFRIP